MRRIKLILLFIPLLLVAACDGESEETAGSFDDEPTFIVWEGSVNGTIVVDATNDAFEFEFETGFLHFGNTTYTNAWVDHSGNFIVDGQIIGGVFYVRSIDNEIITALVSNNGHYIDIFGPESNLSWAETNVLPIFAINAQTGGSNKQTGQPFNIIGAQQGVMIDANKAASPSTNNNAISERLPQGNQGALLSK